MNKELDMFNYDFKEQHLEDLKIEYIEFKLKYEKSISIYLLNYNDENVKQKLFKYLELLNEGLINIDNWYNEYTKDIKYEIYSSRELEDLGEKIIKKYKKYINKKLIEY